jgi:dienelactone hydrolase
MVRTAGIRVRAGRLLAGLAVASLALTGCGPAVSSPDGASTGPVVTIRRGLAVEGITTADVFAPAAVADAPTVVMLHGTRGERSAMEPLAVEVAAGGAVVFVPSWPVIDQVAPFPVDARQAYQRQVDAVACSIEFAREHAPLYGGDPDEVTLLGHSGGATAGARVALTDRSDAVTSCAAGRSSVPERFIGTGGDYLGVYQYGLERPVDYEPFDLFRITPERLGVEFRLIHSFGDASVDSLVATRFDARLRTQGLDSAIVYTDGGHGDLIDPTTRAGRFVVDQVLALVHAGTSAFDGPSSSTRLTLGIATDGHDGVVPLLGEPAAFVLVNSTARSGWFAFVGLAAGSDLTLDDLVAETASHDTSGFPPDFVDFGGFVPAPAGSSTTLTWVRLGDEQRWAVYTMLDPDPLDPMRWPSCVLWNATAMQPIAVFETAPTGSGPRP